MYREISWMTRADQHILEFMVRCDDGDALLTPKVIAHNIHYDRSYVGKRLRNELTPNDLTVDEGNGLYRLSDYGKAYLEGELDAADLDPSDL